MKESFSNLSSQLQAKVARNLLRDRSKTDQEKASLKSIELNFLIDFEVARRLQDGITEFEKNVAEAAVELTSEFVDLADALEKDPKLLQRIRKASDSFKKKS